jgi:hypothetical protein
MVFFFFPFFFILIAPTSSVHNFLIFCVQIEWFKLLWNRHLKLYKSSCNSKGNRVIFKDFLRGSEIGYEVLHWGLFCKMTHSPTLEGHNFLASCLFLLIFSAVDVPRGGLHLLFGHHNLQWALLQKQQANPTLSDPWWAFLPYISSYMNVRLSSKQVKQIKCGTRLDRCCWRAIKLFPPICLLYINYDRCFKLSIPSIYHTLFKYKNVIQGKG